MLVKQKIWFSLWAERKDHILYFVFFPELSESWDALNTSPSLLSTVSSAILPSSFNVQGHCVLPLKLLILPLLPPTLGLLRFVCTSQQSSLYATFSKLSVVRLPSLPLRKLPEGRDPYIILETSQQYCQALCVIRTQQMLEELEEGKI